MRLQGLGMATALALTILTPRAIAALSFQFEQVGYLEGAAVTGTFTGEDLDLNGQLSAFSGEISAFSMSFSGNSLVAPFNLGLGDLAGFVYDLDGGPLGDGLILDIEGIGAGPSPEQYVAGPGPFNPCGIGVDCAFVFDGVGTDVSGELITVTIVPEPSTALLTALGLAWLGGGRRRRSTTR